MPTSKKSTSFLTVNITQPPSPTTCANFAGRSLCLISALKPPLKALYFRGGARVDGRLLTAAMLNAAQNRGLNLLGELVDQLVIETRPCNRCPRQW